ncbi:type IV pilus assembly protein PilA [Luteibacter rhizovicinus]|uniref:Type IV pilus assembly protein PilA n=1 Tax=Luteibacter rhizovicinus TaxID=242606 RepID=A0A4R3YTA4_9GAMM|nr:pilin [Luteibacter rhizovicinus]TCV94948.1 type IV pilus assembly protein PilA [Luteibacter rhizovicinus]
MPSKRSTAGFTLIELMIVVAIIAILSAIAIPAYKDYLIRAQVSEGVTLATGAKVAVWEFVTNKGAFPSSNESAGLPTPSSIAGKYVSTVEVKSSGTIEVGFNQPDTNDSLQKSILVLSPVNNGGSIGWTCKGSINSRYLPTSCRPT